MEIFHLCPVKILKLYRDSFSGLPLIVWKLSAVMFVNRAGSMVLPFISLYLTKIMGYSFTQSGIALGCFGVGSLIGAWAGGALTDRIGHYPVQAGSLIFGGLSFMVLMNLTSFLSICVALLITAAINDALRPANMTSIAAYTRKGLRTRSIGLVRLAVNLGFSFGPAAGGLIAASLGYKWLFFVDGMTCIVAGIVFLIAIPRDKAQPPDEEEADLPAHTKKSVWHDREYIIMMVLVLLTALIFMQYFYAIPVHLEKNMFLGEAYIGLLMAVNGFVIVLSEIPLIYYLENKWNTFNYMIIGIVMIGIAFLVYVAGIMAFVAWLSILFITFGEILNFPFVTTAALERGPQKNTGTYMGLYTMSWSVAAIIAPVAGLFIAEHFGFNTLWYGIFFLSCIVAAGYVYLKPRW